MKTIIALLLIAVAFGAGMLFENRREAKRILYLSSYWHLVGPESLPGIPQTPLDPAGVAIWKCPALVKDENTIFYAPIGYVEGLSGCKQSGVAKIIMQVE